MTITLGCHESILSIGADGQIHYRIPRRLDFPPLTWRDRLLIWRRRLQPLPVRAGDIADLDFFRMFLALKLIYGAAEDDRYITLRLPGSPTTHLAELTKDFFCTGAVWDIEINGASLRNLQNTRKPDWQRLHGAPGEAEVHADTLRRFARAARVALEHVPRQALPMWADWFIHGGWQMPLRLVWFKWVVRSSATQTISLTDCLPAGLWATLRQTTGGLLLEAQARGLLPQACEEFWPDYGRAYSWRWRWLSRLLCAVLRRVSLP